MIHHLRAAGVSLVVDARGAEVPRILHWGADLGPLGPDALERLALALVPAVPPSSLDRPPVLSVLAGLADGWSGLPAVDTDCGPRAAFAHVETTLEADVLVTMSASDALEVTTRLRLTPEGVLLGRHVLTARADVTVSGAALVLPVPDRAREVLDFSGLWAHERRPQRLRPGHGVWLREGRHGRGGHDDAFLLAAGTPGFGFRGGEVWATHVAFSGDTRQWFERSALGAAVLGAGERRQPVALAAGARLETPVVVATYSDAGLDGLSARLHPWIRSWSTHTGVRPLTLNTWEAVYFDHSLERLTPLVARAAEVGVERFVLDDGWFLGRTDDRRALGDWVVDPRTWPDGLGPLAAAVTDAGMQFGLWVEPEMVSPDSRLARAHPEWMLDTPAGTWRWQHALDLAQPDAAAYVFDHLDALLREYPIAYLKWDHNRDLLVPDSHAQTVALYALIDRLRTAHPGVEIESCASGGARIDLGILSRVDRVWTSDTNDPIERQAIQRYTGVLIPPEYLGSHVGDARAHTTGRTASLSFRLATAFFGHAGIESDLTRLDEGERQAIAAWAAAYRAHRPLLHTGRVVRGDGADAATIVHGVVAPDAGEAIYALAAVDVPDAAVPAPMRMPGLDATAEYEVTVIDFGAVGVLQDVAPPWLHDGVRMSGRVLADVGVAVPLLLPGEAVLLHVRAAAS